VIQTAPRRIAFLGFGLITGSIARALGAHPPLPARPELVGWSPSNRGPHAALRDGALDRVADDPAAAVRDADLVVLGAPPLQTIELLAALGGPLRAALTADAVITDVASTKARVVVAADAAGLRFVGGHPMAGREAAGYAAAVPDLFVGRPWVIVPGAAADAAAVERVTWLASACGARAVRLDAAAHDRATAAISHLPLIVSAALAEAIAGAATERPGWAEAAPLAASGWRDMTRLARGDARMGAEIGATNGAAIIGGLRDFQAVVDEWIAELERDGGPDPARLEARLRAVSDRLEGARGDRT
jgi:prephenate dehydrogenase